MNLPTDKAFPPVTHKGNIESLAALLASPDITPELWTEVHDEVQRQLAVLETEVRLKLPAVRVESSHTKGERFFLFTYRTFSVPGSRLDPVVAGLTFTPAGDEVTVEADVSGEQTGDWISSLPGKRVAKSKEELAAAARDLAHQLCQAADAIVAALRDPTRKVE